MRIKEQETRLNLHEHDDDDDDDDDDDVASSWLYIFLISMMHGLAIIRHSMNTNGTELKFFMLLGLQ